MTTKEIRDKLVEQRTNYQNSIKESEKACSELKELFGKLDGAPTELLAQYGFDVSGVTTVDLDRLKTDRDYAIKYKEDTERIAEKLHKFLEEQVS